MAFQPMPLSRKPAYENLSRTSALRFQHFGLHLTRPVSNSARGRSKAVREVQGRRSNGTALMRKTMKRFLILLVVASPAFGQAAASADGNHLIEECGTAIRMMMDSDNIRATSTESRDFAYCVGLVQGVGDALNEEGRIALPQGAGVGQLVHVVDKYLHDHPEELAERNTRLVIKALKKAFPPKGTK
jgi:Ssp1 endopeptidase immunity protein Rap1a